MAEEQLTLVDGMSASLRRIYLEAEKLNKRMLTLKADIKSLEKPLSLSYLRRELKQAENQANLTASALKRAVKIGYGEGILSWNPRYGGNQYHSMYGQRQFISDADLVRYGQRLQQTPLRRNKMLWDNGRIVNGMTFEQRLMARQRASMPFYNISDKLNLLKDSSESLSNKFLRVGSTVLMVGYLFERVAGIIKDSFIQPQSQYISNLTRVALTNNRNKTPKQMMNELYDTASRTRAPADASFMLYNRIALSGVKASNERIRRFVESFNKVTAISGTTGQENRAVMLQLAQGIGSNRLGGDEFRSISEQAPLFKYMLAKGLGVNPGALKNMGAEGKLTAEAILSSMEKVQDEIDLIFKDAPLTIDQAFTIFQNKWSQILNEQFTGYLAIRDLIKDITLWMESAEGQEIISSVIQGWNNLMKGTVNLLRMMAPPVSWLIRNFWVIKGILLSIINLNLTGYIIKSMAMAELSVKRFRIELETTKIAGAGMWSALSKGAVAFGAVASAVLGWIGLIVEAIILAWKIGEKIADKVEQRRELTSTGVQEDQLIYNKHQAWQNYARKRIKEQGLTLNENFGRIGTKENSIWNKSIQYNPEYQKWEKNIWAPIEKQVRDRNDQWQKENNIGKYKKSQEDIWNTQLAQITGMADSSKNVPMVGKVKEVGKVNDKISIDNDGIEMMKAIAERQWIMQNEVTVPQQVDVHVSKEVDVSDEKIAESLIGGVKIAVASSMRGAPA